MYRKKYFIIALSALLLMSCSGGKSDKSVPKKTRYVTIGTGGVTGVYYPTGGAIAKIVNNRSSEYGIKATAEATGGSVFNINAVLAGDLDLGIAQSDRQYQAYHGKAEWEGNPHKNLRSLFSLHAEAVTLIASVPSGIVTPLDMKGKRIAIGNLGSGHRGNAIDALGAYGIGLDEIMPEDLKPAECAGTLQDGRIDAYFYTVGHPNGSIKEAVAGTTPVMFVSISKIDDLLAKYSYYAPAEIDIKHYDGVANSSNAKTFGVKATIVCTAEAEDDLIYSITREVFENFRSFTSLHPALESLEKAQLLEGLTAPIHDGAHKYFVEAGLIATKAEVPQSIN